MFSDPYQKFSSMLRPDAMVMAIGKGEPSGDMLKVLVNEVVPMEAVRERFAKSVHLKLDLSTVSENTIVELRTVIERHRGKCQCFFDVAGGGFPKNSLYFTRRHTIDPSDEFLAAVRRILGESAVRLRG